MTFIMFLFDTILYFCLMIFNNTSYLFLCIHSTFESANIVNIILNKKKTILVKVNGMYQPECINNKQRIDYLINQPYFNN
jgi:DNA-binding sugar fermentation-stimulating protein